MTAAARGTVFAGARGGSIAPPAAATPGRPQTEEDP